MKLIQDFKAMFRELFEYRELFLTLVRRDVMVRYRRTILGVGWALFVPVMNMIVFTVIFNRVAKIQTDVPYPIFVYTGLLPWTMFSSSLKIGLNSLLSSKNLVTKIFFPRELLPFSSLTVALIDFLIGGVLLAVLMLYYGVPFQSTLLALPLLMAIQITFAAGLCLALAMANLWYRDVKYVFDVVVQLWMFATPVVYPIKEIGEPLRTILHLNPMTPIIEGYRSLVLYGQLPPPQPLLWAAAGSLCILLTSWLVFHRAEYRFAENI